MTNFIQLHLLTSYAPSNLNRDDLGRPKTAIMGGKQRLRVSSQSLKRSWRTSDVFQESLGGHVGVRTKEMGVQIYQRLIEKGVSEKKSEVTAKAIAAEFGAMKKAGKNNPMQAFHIEQLAHFAPEEITAIHALVDLCAEEDRAPDTKELELLRAHHTAVDIAMFGRMLASSPKFNTEAAVQVAHALTVHEAVVEDDFYTAVDDLNRGDEDAGAAHLGETEFGAGLFYLYICINRDLLTANVSDDAKLAKKALRALVESAATIAPGGKQNSFASRAYASYVLAEKGTRQPRSLAVSFLKPSHGQDPLAAAVKQLEATRNNMDAVYGPVAKESMSMNAAIGEGSLQAILDFVSSWE